MRRGAGWVIALAVFAPDVTARAADTAGSSWSGAVRVEQAYNDNVEQQEGTARQGDAITSIGAHIGWTNPRRRRPPAALSLDVTGHVYADLSDFNYVEIQPEAVVPLWWRTDGIIGYRYSPRRLLFDEDGGDEVFYQDHVVTAGLRRKFGARRQWRSELRFEGEWTDYRSPDDERNAFAPGGVWDLRYRFDPLAGWTLTPRTDVEYAARDARRENYDRNAVEVGPGLQIERPGGPVLRLRYAHTWRDYTVDAPRGAAGRNNNYRRDDEYDQVQGWIIVPLPHLAGVSLGARYRYRAGVYDEPNRKAPDGSDGVTTEFDVHEVGLEITYAF
jgi:hypothetical protein